MSQQREIMIAAMIAEYSLTFNPDKNIEQKRKNNETPSIKISDA